LVWTKVYQDLYSIARVDGEASLTQIHSVETETLLGKKAPTLTLGLEAALFNRLNLNVDLLYPENHRHDLQPSVGSLTR